MIAIIGAMKSEVEMLISHSKNIRKETIHKHDFYLGTLENKKVIITELGIGKVNAAINLTLLLTNYQVDYIINTGIAGGLKPLNINDVIISDKIYHSDVDIRFFGYNYGQVAGDPQFYQSSRKLQSLIKPNKLCKVANICSGDKFVTSINMVNDILKIDNTICVCDMESAALAQVASRFNKEFVVIRAISDIVNDENQLEKYDEAKTTKVSQDVLMELLKNLGD